MSPLTCLHPATIIFFLFDPWRKIGGPILETLRRRCESYHGVDATLILTFQIMLDRTRSAELTLHQQCSSTGWPLCSGVHYFRIVGNAECAGINRHVVG